MSSGSAAPAAGDGRKNGAIGLEQMYRLLPVAHICFTEAHDDTYRDPNVLLLLADTAQLTLSPVWQPCYRPILNMRHRWPSTLGQSSCPPPGVSCPWN